MALGHLGSSQRLLPEQFLSGAEDDKLIVKVFEEMTQIFVKLSAGSGNSVDSDDL